MVLRLLLLLSLSACYLKHYPLTPAVVSGATYRAMTPEGGGTAWAVGKHHLVSAGHVCEMEGPFRMESQFRRFYATPVLWWKDGEGLRDLCVLKTEIALDSWLILSSTMPKKGDKIGYVGYPNLDYGEFTGFYLGDLDGDENMNNDVSTAPCAPGASGSAMYKEDGVWGVLVRLRTDGGYIHDPAEGCVAVRLDYLVDILNEAGVKYDVPPELQDDI